MATNRRDRQDPLLIRYRIEPFRKEIGRVDIEVASVRQLNGTLSVQRGPQKDRSAGVVTQMW